MTNRTITAANSLLYLSVRNLYPVSQQIQGYAADAAFLFDAFDTAEAVMGVDGRMSAGFTPAVKVMTVTLQADSTSNDFFDNWQNAQRTAREIYYGDGQVVLPAVRKVFTLTKAVLNNLTPMPAVNRTLQQRQFRLTWEDVVPAPL